MVVISLPNRFADNFGDPIQKMLSLINDISGQNIQQRVILDCKNSKFTHPFFFMALPLVVEQYRRRGYDIECDHAFENQSVRDYMNYLRFPEGIRSSGK